MAAIDMAENIRKAALAAIEAGRLGEDYAFDASPVIIPTPTGQPFAAYLLVISCKSPLLGNPPLAHMRQLPTSQPTDEQIEQAVTQGIAELRAACTRILTETPPQAPTFA